jgi:hypothetical protein
MHSAIEAFERRMTLRLYVVGVGIVLAQGLLRHFWDCARACVPA